MNSITSEWGKWSQTIKISLSKQMAYKTNLILTILAPTTVFFILKYNLWRTIFLQQSEPIAGYDFPQMIIYQIWVTIIGLIAMSNNMMEISEDIRLGKISAYIIYPFSFMKFHFSQYIASTLLQIIICAILIGVALVGNVDLSFQFFIQGISITLLVSILWFFMQYILGLLAFWLEETWVLRVMLIIVIQFFSGAILPLDLYPELLKEIIMYTPFPYMTYIPTQIFMGSDEFQIGNCIIIILGWISFFGFIARKIWHKGLNLYTAAGM